MNRKNIEIIQFQVEVLLKDIKLYIYCCCSVDQCQDVVFEGWTALVWVELLAVAGFGWNPHNCLFRPGFVQQYIADKIASDGS